MPDLTFGSLFAGVASPVAAWIGRHIAAVEADL